MTLADYLIDIGLIALVLFQIRGRRLTTRALVLPLAIVGYVAEATVKTHVNRIIAKTASRDRAQAAVYAHRHGLAVPADPGTHLP